MFIAVLTLDFWDLIDKINAIQADIVGYRGATTVFLEATDKIPYVWGYSDRPSPDKVRQYTRLARNVGYNQMITKLIREWCERRNIPLVDIVPSKRSMTKMQAVPFKHLTKYPGQTSEHGRDAAMLVWGR